MSNFIIIPIALALYLVLAKIITKVIANVGESKKVAHYRIQYVIRTLRILLGLIILMLTLLFYGIEYAQVSVFVSSIFAVIGVAFFAQWSILSNVTASILIFFGFPYRVGDTIEVVDSDVPVKGVIEDITLFHVLIKRETDMVTYPNTLILQKPVIKF